MSKSKSPGSDPTKVSEVADADGKFVRQTSSFRGTIEKGGKHPPEKGRYLLYIINGCPWAHRAWLYHQLKGLNDVVTLINAGDTSLGPEGWDFSNGVDHVNGFKNSKEVYLRANPDYDMRYTVPILWDQKLMTIVNNESSEIIRIFNSAFNDFIDEEHAKRDFYPEPLRQKIDELNAWVYDLYNNGVYKTGFATSQSVYEENVRGVFKAMDQMDEILSKNKYLVGDQLTEADIRAYTTSARFDVAYHGAFKCNIRLFRSYPNLNRWLKSIYWSEEYPEFKHTTLFDSYKKGYYRISDKSATPILPLGPIPPIEPL